CSSLSTHHSWSWTLLKAPETSWHFLQWLFSMIPITLLPQAISHGGREAEKRHGDQER
ncbi:unnamed protein product, partial [Brassica oleracea var. botrytis]